MTNKTPGSRLETTSLGAIAVPPFTLPLSAALSPAAAKAQAAALQQVNMLPNFAAAEDEAQFRAMVDLFRAGLNEGFLKPTLARMAAEFRVQMQGDILGGVSVEEFTPLSGLDEERVLINLHGGLFISGAVLGGRLEAFPIAHFGKFRVISVDYRQGYEHRYPAASQDVEAVYRALLQRYPAERIGIYGSSAGGVLTAQATAWLLNQGLPAPGAIGILGAGTGGLGDSAYFAAIGSGRQPAMPLMGDLNEMKYGYFAGADPQDKCVRLQAAPVEFRAKFPPSLFVTGTRAFDLSPTISTHRALCQAGVQAELHVFDGLGHCFFADPWLPESADVNATIIRFFRKYLS